MAHRWDKYREPEAKNDPNGCPSCGGKVVYRGFTNVECDGDPFCPNWVQTKKLEAPLEEDKTQPYTGFYDANGNWVQFTW